MNAGPQRVELARVAAAALGKDEHSPTVLKVLEDGHDAFLADAVLVNQRGIEAAADRTPAA